MHYLALFFAGAFLCNALSHLAAGLQGRPFPTPFAKPRGIGDSSASANFLWGFLNLAVGLVLLGNRPGPIGATAPFAALLLGILLTGLHLSFHFAKVRGDRKG